MSFPADVLNYLAGLGIGTANTNLFYSFLPDSPDSAIVLYPTGGRSPVFTHDQPLPDMEHPSLQVVCRDPDFDTAMTTAFAVYGALAAVRNQRIGSAFYQAIVPDQLPFFLRYDQSDRAMTACNYSITKGRDS